MRVMAPEGDAGSISVRGRAYPIRVVRTRARTARASLRGGEVVVRLPSCLDGKRASEALANLRGRLERRLERDPYLGMPRRLELQEGQELSAMGRLFRISVEQGGRASAMLSSGSITVRLPEGLPETERAAAVSELSARALSRAMLPLVSARVHELNSAHFRFRISRVSLRNSSSRWGSCNSRTGSINLNVRLLFAPQQILDYVIVHELAHLRHPNHSRAFWSCVGEAFQGYRDARRWLRERGNGLGLGRAPCDAEPRQPGRPS